MYGCTYVFFLYLSNHLLGCTLFSSMWGVVLKCIRRIGGVLTFISFVCININGTFFNQLSLFNRFIHSFMDVLPLTNVCLGWRNRINVETEGLRYSRTRWMLYVVMVMNEFSFFSLFHVNQTKCGMLYSHYRMEICSMNIWLMVDLKTSFNKHSMRCKFNGLMDKTLPSLPLREMLICLTTIEVYLGQWE